MHLDYDISFAIQSVDLFVHLLASFAFLVVAFLYKYQYITLYSMQFYNVSRIYIKIIRIILQINCIYLNSKIFNFSYK